MKEENIRPDNLMEMEEKKRNEDIKDLLKFKKQFVFIPCPACESKENNKIFKKNGFIFVRCKKCETLFINPRPTIEMLVNYYANSRSLKFWSDYIYPASEESRRENIFIPRVQQVIKLCEENKIENDILLDVGAGFGTFCEELVKLNFFNKVIAVEPSHNLAEIITQKNIEVLEMPIEDVILDKVNVITNFELIEHLFCPKDFLISCNKVLTNNGLLILTTPNIKGFDLLVLNKLSDNVDFHHINYFHPESLKLLLENTGFKVLEVLTPGKLDAELVRKKFLSGIFDISLNPFLKQILVEKWDLVGNSFQEFLSKMGLSSHLWIVAKKIANT